MPGAGSRYKSSGAERGPALRLPRRQSRSVALAPGATQAPSLGDSSYRRRVEKPGRVRGHARHNAGSHPRKARTRGRLRRLRWADRADELVPGVTAPPSGQREGLSPSPFERGRGRGPAGTREGVSPSQQGRGKGRGQPASDRQGPVGQADQQEPQGEQHSRQLWKVRRRSSRSSVVSLRVVLARSKSRRGGSEQTAAGSESEPPQGSARRRRWERVNRANLVEAHHQKLVSRSRLRPVEHIRMKRAPNEKECSRALVLSRRSIRAPASSNNSSNNKGGAPASADHGPGHGQPEAGHKDNQDQRRRQGSNNFGAIIPAAPEHTPRSRFWL